MTKNITEKFMTAYSRVGEYLSNWGSGLKV